MGCDIMKKLSVIIVMFFILFIMFNMNVVKATLNPDEYRPTGVTDTDVNKVSSKVNPIIGTIKTVGIVISVVTLIVLGFKYMIGSVQEKAEYKKTMIPYLIGAVLIVAVTQLVSLIANIVTNIKY